MPPPTVEIAPAQVQEPSSRFSRNIWARSDLPTFIPLVEDSSGPTTTLTNTDGQGSMEDSTDPYTQSLQHKHAAADAIAAGDGIYHHSNTADTIGQNENTNASAVTGIEDLMSRGDVFAGVIVFSVGMLVLIIAVTFYFANGRSLRTVRRNRNRARSLDARRSCIGGTCEGAADNVLINEGDIDLEREAQVGITTGAGAGTTENPSTFDPHSPSTARLIDYPAAGSSSSFPSTSVFAFLKGTHPSSSSTSNNNGGISLKSSQIGTTSIISKTGQDYDHPDGDSEATTLHMPMLTRTKARSSCKRKNKGMISLFSSATSSSSGGVSKKQKHQRQKQQQAAALEIARSASAIIIQIQEPSEPASSARPLSPTNTNTDTNTTQDFIISSDDPEQDIFSPINPTSEYSHRNNNNNNNNTHPLLRLEMPSTIRSSSIVGLYGSAKSSPNGSMVDAASTRAIYCTSLKSAMSFLPTESTSTLGVMHTAELNPSAGVGQNANENEIVIATAGLEAT